MAGPSDGSDYSLWLHLTALLVLMEEEKRSQTGSCASARALSTVAQLFQSTPFIATAIRLTFTARRCAQCTGKLPLPVLTCGQTSELKPRPTPLPNTHARARHTHALTCNVAPLGTSRFPLIKNFRAQMPRGTAANQYTLIFGAIFSINEGLNAKFPSLLRRVKQNLKIPNHFFLKTR